MAIDFNAMYYQNWNKTTSLSRNLFSESKYKVLKEIILVSRLRWFAPHFNPSIEPSVFTFLPTQTMSAMMDKNVNTDGPTDGPSRF